MWQQHDIIEPDYVSPWTIDAEPAPSEGCEPDEEGDPGDWIQHTFGMLGKEVRDQFNGFTGSVTGVSFDIGGLAQCRVENVGVSGDPVVQWCEISRLETVGSDHFGFRSIANGNQSQAPRIHNGAVYSG